jgi:nucleoside phosphorylase
MGPTSAAASLLRLLDREKVAAIISLGFAGGIERGLAAGELLDLWWIINEAGDALDVRDRIPHPATNAAERTPQRTLLSVDRVIESVVMKRRLYEKHLAAAFTYWLN